MSPPTTNGAAEDNRWLIRWLRPACQTSEDTARPQAGDFEILRDHRRAGPAAAVPGKRDLNVVVAHSSKESAWARPVAGPFSKAMDRFIGIFVILFPASLGSLPAATVSLPPPGAYLVNWSGTVGAPEQSDLWRLDLGSRAVTLVRDEIPGVIQGLTFSPVGDLLGWHLAFPGSPALGLVAIDFATGNLQDIGADSSFTRLQSIEFDATGQLYGVSQQGLYRVDSLTGVATWIGGDFEEVRGLAIRGVPEPGTGLLALASFGLAAGMRRTRHRRIRP